MTPPQLAADTPILDVLQPVLVCHLVFRWIELDFVVHHRRQGKVSKVLHAQEPLHRKLWLDSHTRALRATHLVRIRLHLLHQSSSLQVLLDLNTHIKAVHADIQTSSLAQRAIIVEDVDGLQLVLVTQHIVVHIVSRSHLQATRSELNIHIVILNHRNRAVHQRHHHLLAAQPSVLRIVRVDTHGSITHDGLRTSGSHNSIITLLILVYHLTFSTCRSHLLTFSKTIFQIIQLRMLLLVNHLLVAERSLSLRVPVHHAHTAINQSLAVEVNKHLDDRLRALLVHRERSAVPIA